MFLDQLDPILMSSERIRCHQGSINATSNCFQGMLDALGGIND